MENLTNNSTAENTSGMIKALAIAFPDAKLSNSNSKLKFHTPTISNEQFENLATVLALYNKEVNLKRSSAKICIVITDAKEVENEKV